jgi:hypothetical protein
MQSLVLNPVKEEFMGAKFEPIELEDSVSAFSNSPLLSQVVHLQFEFTILGR